MFPDPSFPPRSPPLAPRPRPRLARALAALAALPALFACGPGSEHAAVDIAYRQHGDGTAVKEISAIHVDSDGVFWQATHAAGVSASVAPDDRMAMSLCQTMEGGPRGASNVDYAALDLGSVTVQGTSDELPLDREELESGRGVAYRAAPDVNVLPFVEGQEYTVRAAGSQQAPGFSARVAAPPPFSIERVGAVSAGAGTIPIQRNRDLTITWTPGSDDAEMFITLSTPTEGLVCRAPDEGEFTIKKRHLSGMIPGRGDLVLERYLETGFDTANASDGRSRSGRLRYGVQRWYRFDLH